MWYQLFRPFGYLKIKHPAKKVVDFSIPLLMMVVALIALALTRSMINMWGQSGLISMIQGLVQGLPGFYIAALAAVATFGRQTELDTVIPEPTPTIQTWYGTGKVEIGLTRRRFLCLMFAHLTALSIVLSVFASFGISLAAPIRTALAPHFIDLLFYLASGVYFFLLFQMLIVTMWGLSYLSDKMHQPDAVALAESDEKRRRES